jgi:hypothetical protein
MSSEAGEPTKFHDKMEPCIENKTLEYIPNYVANFEGHIKKFCRLTYNGVFENTSRHSVGLTVLLTENY